MRLGDFHATSFPALFKLAAHINWGPWLDPAGPPVRLRVSARKSRLYHSGAIAERFQHALERRVPGIRFAEARADGEEPSGDEQEQLILVRIDHDHVHVSLDSSGSLLSRRGYRQQTAKAPIRENLAAALLMHAGWRGEGALIDPFCGSGTLAIEAAEMALGLAAGRRRSFAFEAWPGGDRDALSRQRELASAPRNGAASGGDPLILASDRIQGAIAATIGNATRAGVLERLILGQHDFFDLKPPAPRGLLVANPPYGQRVSAGKKPSRFLAKLRVRLEEAWSGWRIAVIIPSRLQGLSGASRADPITDNGGIPIRFLSTTVGSSRSS
jgi:putative N6-adenine-specific DNA methylase